MFCAINIDYVFFSVVTCTRVAGLVINQQQYTSMPHTIFHMENVQQYTSARRAGSQYMLVYVLQIEGMIDDKRIGTVLCLFVCDWSVGGRGGG